MVYGRNFVVHLVCKETSCGFRKAHAGPMVGISAAWDEVEIESGSIVSSLLPQRLQCSSFVVMSYFLLSGCNILQKKELHSNPWVVLRMKYRLGKIQYVSLSRNSVLYEVL